MPAFLFCLPIDHYLSFTFDIHIWKFPIFRIRSERYINIVVTLYLFDFPGRGKTYWVKRQAFFRLHSHIPDPWFSVLYGRNWSYRIFFITSNILPFNTWSPIIYFLNFSERKINPDPPKAEKGLFCKKKARSKPALLKIFIQSLVRSWTSRTYLLNGSCDFVKKRLFYGITRKSAQRTPGTYLNGFTVLHKILLNFYEIHPVPNLFWCRIKN